MSTYLIIQTREVYNSMSVLGWWNAEVKLWWSEHPLQVTVLPAAVSSATIVPFSFRRFQELVDAHRLKTTENSPRLIIAMYQRWMCWYKIGYNKQEGNWLQSRFLLRTRPSYFVGVSLCPVGACLRGISCVLSTIFITTTCMDCRPSKRHVSLLPKKGVQNSRLVVLFLGFSIN
jgi:hypothetical protein